MRAAVFSLAILVAACGSESSGAAVATPSPPGGCTARGLFGGPTIVVWGGPTAQQFCASVAQTVGGPDYEFTTAGAGFVVVCSGKLADGSNYQVVSSDPDAQVNRDACGKIANGQFPP